MKRSHSEGKEKVSIANLKAKLAHYLRKVRAGEEIIITEHNRPIARIVQLEAAEGLQIIPAKGPFAEVAGHKLKPLEGGDSLDTLSHLLKERGNR